MHSKEEQLSRAEWAKIRETMTNYSKQCFDRVIEEEPFFAHGAFYYKAATLLSDREDDWGKSKKAEARAGAKKHFKFAAELFEDHMMILDSARRLVGAMGGKRVSRLFWAQIGERLRIYQKFTESIQKLLGCDIDDENPQGVAPKDKKLLTKV